MQVIIAGDIIGSKKKVPSDYLTHLETTLKEYCGDLFQIYRGDSFQGLVTQPEKGLTVSLLLKSLLQSHKLDVRVALGLGEVEIIDNNIAISTGSALTRSGELLDSLKEKGQQLMVTGNHSLDIYMNTSLKMALTFINQWTVNGAAAIYQALKNPNATQTELGAQLGIKQGAASRRLERACWEETQALILLFKNYYQTVSHDITI